MLFSSVPFLFGFLPCVLLLYFAVPRRGKNAVLLAASLVFYGWGEPRYLLLLLAAVVQGYIFALLIQRHRGRPLARLWLTLSVALSLGMLGVFKYTDFVLRSVSTLTGLALPLLHIALPIGISFYTFQILSYVVDVYRGDVPAQKNFIDLAAYIAMFPQLIAGPIVRYVDIAGQLENRRHSLADAAAGTRRFVLGLGKKVLLANLLGELAAACRAASQGAVLLAWLWALAWALQVYFDFSGYSDMAIGLGRIFGFHFLENFHYPYISASVTEFWRRWHISLGTWFRDYLYIPLGGNRVSRPRWLLNLLIVWLATGLWHGAAWNFALWGLYYAVLLIAEKLWLGKALARHPALGRVYTALASVLGFVLFGSDTLAQAGATFAAMWGAAGLPLATAESLYYLRSYGVVLVLAAVGATPLPRLAAQRLAGTRWGRAVLAAGEPLALTALLAVCTAFLIDGSFNPFLYFRF